MDPAHPHDSLFALAFGETYGEFASGNGAYYLATAFERITLQPVGLVGLTGLMAEVPFARALLDRIGVQAAFERLVSQAKGRVAIAMFGSHLHRVQHSLALAAKVGRKVVLLGRSLQRNVALAIDAGLLASPGELLVEPDAARQLSPERVLILSTGAQAEVRSGLSNLVSAEPGPLRLQAGDTAIISARTIPGNEREVNTIINGPRRFVRVDKSPSISRS